MTSQPTFDDMVPEWRLSTDPVPYEVALAEMESRVAAIRAGTASELIWLLEHPPLITAGIQADPEELLQPDRFPVIPAGRGGRYTYHGPGQRIVYALLDLRRRKWDVRLFIERLEEWMIASLADFGVTAFPSEAGVGVWVNTDAGEAKIGAIGVRVRHAVSFHGMSVNVVPDLDHFNAIVPCGIADRGVVRLADLVPEADMAGFDAALARHFSRFLAPTRTEPREDA